MYAHCVRCTTSELGSTTTIPSQALTNPIHRYSLYSPKMSVQKAVVHKSNGVSELRSDVPLPTLPGDDWILVKTKAVALNPTDWKNIDKATAPGAIAGCDYAGVVEEVGNAVTKLKVGDKVAGFARGGKNTASSQIRIAPLIPSTQVIRLIAPTAPSPNISKPNLESKSSFPMTSRLSPRQPLV